MPETTRTLANAVMDVRYGYHYGELNQRLWSHLDTTLNLAGALGGSAAVASLFAASPALVLSAGITMACVSVLQLVLRPAQRAAEFRDAKRSFAELDAKAWDMPLADLDRQLKGLQASAPIGSSRLGMPAYNACVRANGHESKVVTLKLTERLVSALA